MTQSELAERLNLTRQAISKYECGDSFPDITILIVLSEIFSISLDDLICSGKPTQKEAEILEKAASGMDLSGIVDISAFEEFVNIAPLLKPSILDKMALGLGKYGIDISSILTLAEYINDDTVVRLLENATYEKLDDTLLAHIIPFLDDNSISIIFQKILDGELDYSLIKVMLPYAEYIYPQVEAAVLYGGLSKKSLEILRESELENDSRINLYNNDYEK
jgi:transcriptional regulator with XRE-family HTH domain